MPSLSSRLGFSFAVGLALTMAPSASAQTYAWSPGTDNLWSNSGNWTPSGIPNLAGNTARFVGGTGTNVDVNGTFTLGRLTVEALSAQQYYDLSSTSGGSLTFNNGASASVIESLPGAGGSTELFLKVPVIIAGNGSLQINNATGVRLQISGVISGAGSNITVNAGGQTGVVTLTGTNTYGGGGSSLTTVAGGTLRANEGIGLPINSTLVLSGGVFELFDESVSTFTFNRTLGSAPQNARLIGGGTTRAGFSVFDGTLTVRLNNDAITVINWGAPNFDPGVLVLGTASPTESNIVIFENALNLNGAVRTVSAEGFGFSNSSYSQMTGVLSGGASAGLTKQGNGILELTATNTYTGRTTISAGVLRANVGQGIHATSPITINGGVLENRGGPVTFSRNIGTGSGQVELISGGFSAFNGTMTIQLNGGSGTVTWGTAGFYATGGAMRLGSTSSNALVNFTNGIDLGAAVRTVEVDGSGSPNALARLSGPISGSGGLTISGNGLSLLELTGSNTYTGETRILEGTVRANHGQGLPASSSLFLDDGGILESIGAVTFSRSLGNGAGQVRLNGNSGFAASGGAMTILLNGGIGTVTWGDANLLPGTGSLVLGSLTANDLVDFQNGIDLAGQVRTVSVFDNALSQTDRARISGAISNGSLVKLGDGVLELTGPNVYTGQTSVLGGVLRANHGVGLPVDSALLLNNMGVIEGIGATTFSRAVGTGTGQVEIGSFGGGFSASGGPMLVQLNGGTGTVVWSAAAGLAGPLVLGSTSSNNLVDFQNGIDLDGGTVSIYANGGQARISGVIANGGIEKYGLGSLELTAANTYNFTTHVWQGRLVVSNTSGSATGTSTVNVQSGGTLTGSGQIVGANGFNALPGSRIEAGGVGGRVLSIGVSTGNFAVVDGTWAFRIESTGAGGVPINSGDSTNGVSPTNHNYLILTSGGNANSVVIGNNANWEIDGTGLSFLPNQRYSYVIGRTALGEVATGTITDQSRFSTIGFTANDYSLTTMSDGRIILNFTPVPEPITVFGIAAAGLGLVGLVRRRR